MPRFHLNFPNHNFTPVFDGWPSFRAKGLRRAPPNLHFATCLDVRPAWCRGCSDVDDDDDDVGNVYVVDTACHIDEIDGKCVGGVDNVGETDVGDDDDDDYGVDVDVDLEKMV